MIALSNQRDVSIFHKAAFHVKRKYADPRSACCMLCSARSPAPPAAQLIAAQPIAAQPLCPSALLLSSSLFICYRGGGHLVVLPQTLLVLLDLLEMGL